MGEASKQNFDNCEQKPTVMDPEATPMHDNKDAKDLLGCFSPKEGPKERPEHWESVNLGLSLGGIYGEPTEQRPLIRSSSTVGNNGVVRPTPKLTYGFLPRSCSLPVSEQSGKESRRIAMERIAAKRMRASPAVVSEPKRREVPAPAPAPGPGPAPAPGPGPGPAPAPAAGETSRPKSPSQIAAWAAASALRSPALQRALLHIKAQAALLAQNRRSEGHQGTGAPKNLVVRQASLLRQEAISEVNPVTVANAGPVTIADGYERNPIPNPITIVESFEIPTATPVAVVNGYNVNRGATVVNSFSNGKAIATSVNGFKGKAIPTPITIVNGDNGQLIDSPVMVDNGCNTVVSGHNGQLMDSPMTVDNSCNTVMNGHNGQLIIDSPVTVDNGCNGNDNVLPPGAMSVYDGESHAEIHVPRVSPLMRMRTPREDAFKDNGIDLMKDMPTVITTGDGPNGRKIEGFLYKYLGGDVRIICICHGRFLSPAEFFEHAGGIDMENSLRHITLQRGSI